MNILIVEGTADSNFGGAESSMLEHCKFLSKEHNIFLSFEEEGNFLKNNFWQESINIKISSPTVQGFINYFKNIVRFLSFINSNNIDLIFTHTIHGFPFLRLIKIINLKKIKIVNYFKWIYNNPDIGLFNKWGLRGIDTCVSINNYVHNYWVKQNACLNISYSIVPDGIKLFDNNILTDRKINKIETILFAARIYEGKGLHILLEAFEEIFNINKNLQLIIAGNFKKPTSIYEEEYIKRVKKKIERLSEKNNLKYIGFKKNIYEILNQVDLVVVPSTWPDSQPLIILESLLAHTPVVATNVGGIPEILPNKFICEPDSHSLAQCLKWTISLPSNILNEEVSILISFIKKNYSLSNTQNKINEIIKSSL